ncbi:hypothetical protein DY000_02041006 [Brassica cretica]|uniref:Uncharacterized protein n=1 Tax=Brassica cretica TaxID=69181 RepID=A0ABQ7BDU9_BRACR|nr:hypothetical protein DY000_02041006 [Brassica cretica]
MRDRSSPTWLRFELRPVLAGSNHKIQQGGPHPRTVSISSENGLSGIFLQKDAEGELRELELS